MDKKTTNFLSITLYISIVFIFGFSITFNTENRALLGILSSLLIVTVSVRYMIVYPSDKYRDIGKIMILFDVALIYWIVLIDKSGISLFYLLALVADSTLNNAIAYGSLITIISYSSYVTSVYARSHFPPFNDFIPFTLYTLCSFLFVFAMMYLTKHQILQRSRLLSAVKEIESKNSQLEEAYKKLKEATEMIEEVTALRERNRIAREIHDTVGHTLTTVLVEIEAGRRLISKDPELAQQKLDLAQDQVRKGLADIRSSVRMLKDRGNILEFIPAIELLATETEKHAGVKIKYELNIETAIPRQLEKLLYNSFLEGITNGIRHGHCSEICFTLNSGIREISLSLCDNGAGCEAIVPGFGLTSMKDRIESFGGTFQITSKVNQGCRIDIRIPLEERIII